MVMNAKELDRHLLSVESAAYDHEYDRLHRLGEGCSHAVLIEAVDSALAQEVLALINSGTIPSEYFETEWRRNRAQRTIQRKIRDGTYRFNEYLKGQLSFDDMVDDAFVPVGEGEVSKIKHLRASTLFNMDQFRYSNVAAVNKEYDNFRVKYNGWFPELLAQDIDLGTLGQQRLDLF